ncbi:MAG: hypothetical protein ACYSU3_02460 [Planctomycetota bacterium]|jgi:hypothetical protein
MIEIFYVFERTSGRINPIILIAPGILAVIAGLVVWLGGLGFRKVLSAVLGAVIGWVVGFFVIGKSMIAASIMAVAAAITATVLNRMIIIILAVSLAVTLGFVVASLGGPYLGVTEQAGPVFTNPVSSQGPPLNVTESILAIKAYIIGVGDQVQQTVVHMSYIGWAIIGVMIIIAIVAIVYLWNLTSALCSAVLGALLIFAGMVLLLLYKGAMPVTVIDRKAPFFAAVFGAMVAFGTVEQLVLCPWFEGRRKKRKQKVKEGKAERSKNLWRT